MSEVPHWQTTRLSAPPGPPTETLCRELPLPADPRHFAALVERHERLRAKQREAPRQAEHLFQSLLHRAFADGIQPLTEPLPMPNDRPSRFRTKAMK